MPSKFDAQEILQVKSNWLVARDAADIALEFAVLGHLPIANSILALTVDYIAHSKSIWSPGLPFAWEATGLWLPFYPQNERTAEALTKLERQAHLWAHDAALSERTLEKCLKAVESPTLSWTRQSVDLAAALDIALRLGRRNQAEEILRKIVKRFHWPGMIYNLSRSRQAWRILLEEKFVSKELRLDAEKVARLGEEIFLTIQRRLRDGPIRRPLRDKTIMELVSMASENTIANARWEETPYDPSRPPTTLLREPATLDAIWQVEKQLGVRLPADYKEFLSVSNGLGDWWNGYTSEPALSRAEAVKILDAIEEDNKWIEFDVELIRIPTHARAFKWPVIHRVIQINEGQTDVVFLLEPGLVARARDALWKVYFSADEELRTHIDEAIDNFYGSKEEFNKMEWCVITWNTHDVDIFVFPSFREFLEQVASETSKEYCEEIEEGEERNGITLRSSNVVAYTCR